MGVAEMSGAWLLSLTGVSTVVAATLRAVVDCARPFLAIRTEPSILL